MSCECGVSWENDGSHSSRKSNFPNNWLDFSSDFPIFHPHTLSSLSVCTRQTRPTMNYNQLKIDFLYISQILNFWTNFHQKPHQVLSWICMIDDFSVLVDESNLNLLLDHYFIVIVILRGLKISHKFSLHHPPEKKIVRVKRQAIWGAHRERFRTFYNFIFFVQLRDIVD